MKLSTEQTAIVESNVGGIKVVKAGAGSGKTRVIVERVKELKRLGYEDKDFLLITFTNKSGKEMSERLEKERISGITVGTFHRVGIEILRNYYKQFNVAEEFEETEETEIERTYSSEFDGNFSILSAKDNSKILKGLIENAHIEKGHALTHSLKKLVGKIREALSLSMNMQMKLSELITTNPEYKELENYTSEVIELGKAYFKEKKRLNAMDYDDILFYWNFLLSRNLISLPYKIIIIDEYQDTNKLQESIALSIYAKGLELFVVGDMNQAIYGWRGARVENILDISEKSLNRESKVYELGTNYRSDERIVKYAESILKGNTDSRFHMNLNSGRGRLSSGTGVRVVRTSDSADETQFIYEEVYDLIQQGVKGKEIAVLYRSHNQVIALEKLLYKKGIPYEMRSGKKFYERDHVLLILSYLRIVRSPRDTLAWIHVLGELKGVGEKLLEKLDAKILKRRYLEKLGTSNGLQTIIEKLESTLGKKKVTKTIVDLFKAANESIKRYKKEIPNVLHIIEPYLSDIYITRYKDKYGGNREVLNGILEDYQAMCDELANEKDVGAYIDKFYLIEEYYMQSTSNKESDEVVTLSTIHRSKGLEWDYVFIMGLNEGELPSKMSLDKEEERRILYVGVTRGRIEVTLSYKQFMEVNGEKVQRRISSFIEKIPDNLYSYFVLDE